MSEIGERMKIHEYQAKELFRDNTAPLRRRPRGRAEAGPHRPVASQHRRVRVERRRAARRVGPDTITELAAEDAEVQDVRLVVGVDGTDALKDELKKWVADQIGKIAQPDTIEFEDKLPKTRSGKIMRRILRKMAAGDTSDLGDTSTLADPSVIENLMSQK